MIARTEVVVGPLISQRLLPDHCAKDIGKSLDGEALTTHAILGSKLTSQQPEAREIDLFMLAVVVRDVDLSQGSTLENGDRVAARCRVLYIRKTQPDFMINFPAEFPTAGGVENNAQRLPMRLGAIGPWLGMDSA
ncbi:hypothetical protein GCM10010170_042090 [Dactylosporangium salmoneum]|uniref:Uncharacterized protein n=1 Tax=Dactylosporangium salmoneum TaxID=53361 RepID=A0ABP5TFZ2_9ACTN